MGRLSQRTWSKGSARGAGERQSSGVVRVHTELDTNWLKALPPACGCGGRKVMRCDDCGARWCPAPGHLRHTCGRSP